VAKARKAKRQGAASAKRLAGVAESSMTAVLGRMAAYTRREISWKWATESSKMKLGPQNTHAFGPYQPPPVAAPGQTKLI